VALTIGDHPKRPFQSLEATASWRFARQLGLRLSMKDRKADQ
jgi:hypothetical protein